MNLTASRLAARSPIKRKRAVAARPQKPLQNQDNPIGEFGKFLRAKLESKFRKARADTPDQLRERLTEALNAANLKISGEGVRKWLQGRSAPKVKDLSKVAKALGYSSWYRLVDAIREANDK